MCVYKSIEKEVALLAFVAIFWGHIHEVKLK